MFDLRKFVSSKVSIFVYVPTLALLGFALLTTGALEGCSCAPPAAKCVLAADCAGVDMACENGLCVQRSGGDGSTTPDKTTTPDNTTTDIITTPDKTTTPDNTTGPKEIGQACGTDTDCITGAQCRDPGGLGIKVCTNDCTTNTNCGQHLCDKHDGVKLGLCLPKCTTSSDCAAPMDLCTAEGHCWKKGGIGALCNDAGECKDSTAKCLDPGGLGPKVCTKECTADADCGSDGICDKHPGVTNYCLPKCNSTADCNVLPHMNLCTTEKHCWQKGNAGSICSQKNECQDAFECKDPGGLGPMVCHKACTSDADCSVDGIQGKCGDPGSGSKICLPSCTGDNDCIGFPHMSKCNNGQCWK